jgi:hypothetical protein
MGGGFLLRDAGSLRMVAVPNGQQYTGAGLLSQQPPPPVATAAAFATAFSPAAAIASISSTTLSPSVLYPVNRPVNPGDIDPITTSSQHFPHWPFGALAACVAALLFVIGMQLLNRGVRPTNERHTVQGREIAARSGRIKNWYCGVFFLLLSFSAQAVALTLAALSLVQPMASLSIVLNALLVPCCFPTERQTLRDSEWITMKGVLIVVIGNALIVSAAAKVNTAYAAEELESLFLQADFVIFELVCVILGLIIFQFARTSSARYHGSRGPFMLFYAYTAGWAGAQQYMFLKAVGECVKSGIHGRAGAALFSATPVIMSFCCLILACMQLWLIIHGLSRFRNETVRFIGCYQGCVVCIGALTGGFYFNEFNDFTQFQWGCFSLGMVLIVWGVLIMSTLRGKNVDTHLQSRGIKNGLHKNGNGNGNQSTGGNSSLCSKLYCYHVCGPCRALVGSDAPHNREVAVPNDYFDPMESAHFAQLWANPDIW